MPVLLTTLLLALGSPTLHEFLESLTLWCSNRLWQLTLSSLAVSAISYYAYIRYSGESDVEDDESAKCKKQPNAPTTISEALAGVAGASFAGSTYVLLFSEHRFRFMHTGRDGLPYLERLILEVTPEQLLAMLVLGASFVVLIGCAGIAFALEGSDMPRLARKHAWSTVVLLVEALAIAWIVNLQIWNIFTGTVKLDRAWSGLLWGLFFAGVGQIAVIAYHFCRVQLGWFRRNLDLIQPDRHNNEAETFLQQVVRHLAQPSAFAIMGAYLVGTWKLSLMPDSYYKEDAPIDWLHVLLQLIVVDFFTVVNHMAEHSISSLYVASHKPHHRFVSPKLFDAFDGSLADTTLLILLPLFSTCRMLTFVNTWSYIAFGFVYSTHFMIIHSEWPHITDNAASKFGIYTARDHHVHHARFVYNYAHFFTFWDRAMGTYREDIN